MQDFISGKYINQGTYKSFQPSMINKSWKIEKVEKFELSINWKVGNLKVEYLSLSS